jgi:DeoR/GlpR family transcriptional regulator of sugar metabolism
MVQRSKQLIAVIDSSKWGQVAFASLAGVDELDHVISDQAAPSHMVDKLRNAGIRVTLVG